MKNYEDTKSLLFTMTNEALKTFLNVNHSWQMGDSNVSHADVMEQLGRYSALHELLCELGFEKEWKYEP